MNGQAVSEIAVATFTRVNSLPPAILAQPQSVTVIVGQPAAHFIIDAVVLAWLLSGRPAAGAGNRQHHGGQREQEASGHSILI